MVFPVLKIFSVILFGALLSLVITFSLAFLVSVQQGKVPFSWEKMALAVTGWLVICYGYIRKPKKIWMKVSRKYRIWKSEEDLRAYRKAMMKVVKSKNNRAAIEVDAGIIAEVKMMSKHDLERLAVQQTLTLEAYMTLYGARLGEAIVLEWEAPRKSEKVKTKAEFAIKGKKVVKKDSIKE